MTLPLSKRTTAAIAVFNSMQSAQETIRLIRCPLSNPTARNPLYLEAAALFSEYQLIITQPTANNDAMLDAAIAKAVVTIGELNTTVQSVVLDPVNYELTVIQGVVAAALDQIKAAAAAQDDE